MLHHEHEPQSTWTSNHKGVRATLVGLFVSGQWMPLIYINHPTILAPSVSYTKTEGEFTIIYYTVGQILTVQYRLTGHCVI